MDAQLLAKILDNLNAIANLDGVKECEYVSDAEWNTGKISVARKNGMTLTIEDGRDESERSKLLTLTALRESLEKIELAEELEDNEKFIKEQTASFEEHKDSQKAKDEKVDESFGAIRYLYRLIDNINAIAGTQIRKICYPAIYKCLLQDSQIKVSLDVPPVNGKYELHCEDMLLLDAIAYLEHVYQEITSNKDKMTEFVQKAYGGIMYEVIGEDHRGNRIGYDANQNFIDEKYPTSEQSE